MSVDKLNERKFDGILEQALQEHSEPTPADFTARMLRQIREAQERRILAQVVLQERLALAGCIVLGIIAIIMVVVFPNIAGSLTGQVHAFIGKITRAIEAVNWNWQFYTVFVAVFGFAVYSLVDLLVGDGLR